MTAKTDSARPRKKSDSTPPQAVPAAALQADPAPAGKPWHVVRRSKVHGSGVFAARSIPPGTRIIEYTGEIISNDEADRRHPVNPDDPFHTFFFAISGGKVIDGGSEGNDARWINHCCEPNCETEETDDGRIFVVSLQPISRGEELNYDYGLVIDERHTKELKNGYLCLCGAPSCRHTMLAPKPKVKKDKKDKKSKDGKGKGKDKEKGKKKKKDKR